MPYLALALLVALRAPLAPPSATSRSSPIGSSRSDRGCSSSSIVKGGSEPTAATPPPPAPRAVPGTWGPRRLPGARGDAGDQPLLLAKAFDLQGEATAKALEDGSMSLVFGQDEAGNRFVEASHAGRSARIYQGAIKHEG